MVCLKRGALFLFVLFRFCYSNTIRMKDGTVRGSTIKCLNDRIVYSYMGMPYAEKPVRFEPPVPVKPWKGVRNATQDGAQCVQRDLINPFPLNVIGEEDCLSCSVYTPYNPKECLYAKKLPVMVFIYGGSWIFGSNEEGFYGPQYLLMKGNILLVTFNYRLNAFGFLATNDKTAAGNWGLLDQALALKWVSQNIKYFGGDPHKVTLFGGSVGAISTHLHCFSALSKGLFHGMISQSGTAYFAPYGVHPAERAANVTKELAEACDCPTNSSVEMVECLRQVPAYDLITKQDTLYGVKDGYPAFTLIVWTPVYDVPFSNKPFFRCDPNEPNCTGCSLPWISGFTSQEGSYYTCGIYEYPQFEALVYQNPYPYLSTYMQLDAIFPKETVPAIMDKIRNFYFQDQPISRNNSQGLVNVFTDFHYYWPAVRALLRHRGPIYLYRYDYIVTGATWATFFGCDSDCELPRPTHYDDFFTLYEVGMYFNRTYTDTDLECITYHTDLWTHFATTLYPTYGCDGKEWDQAGTETNFKYLALIGEKPVLNDGLPYPERYNFWEGIAKEYSCGRVELIV